MFTGFKIDYPEYTIITPQTGLMYGVRYLKVSEVSKIKQSITVPAKATTIINQVLWDSLVSKPSGLNKYEDYLKITTLRDREAMMYALFITSFGDEREFDLNCSECNTENKIKTNMSDMFSITPYPGSNAMKASYGFSKASGAPVDPLMEHIRDVSDQEEKNKNMEDIAARKRAAIEQKMKEKASKNAESNPEEQGITLGEKPSDKELEKQEVEASSEPKQESLTIKELSNITGILSRTEDVTLPKTQAHVIMKQPTIWDEKRAYEEIPFAQRKQTDLVNEILIIDRFEIYKPGGKTPVEVLRDREDVLHAYQELPNSDKQFLVDKFKENFGEYGIDLKHEWQCTECGGENTLHIDIVMQFFRMVALS